MKKHTVAMMYDFDKTLCTKDMQEYTFIPALNMKPDEFWKKAAELSDEQGMDKILGYMYLMLRESKRASHSIRREDFVRLGQDVEYFEGVENWFAAINQFGKSIGIEIEHYIISSGLCEIIQGSSIYKHFKKVYACEFLYDENGVACWPKNAVNYTTKTQFLFRINKGALELNDDETLNASVPEDDRRIPFRNMIYIGDGMTDVPCMRLVKEYGGFSVAVYGSRQGKTTNKGVAERLLRERRVNFAEKADYREDSQLFQTVCAILQKMSAEEKLVHYHKKQMKQQGTDNREK